MKIKTLLALILIGLLSNSGFCLLEDMQTNKVTANKDSMIEKEVESIDPKKDQNSKISELEDLEKYKTPTNEEMQRAFNFDAVIGEEEKVNNSQDPETIFRIEEEHVFDEYI